jgi:hypothetical protein
MSSRRRGGLNGITDAHGPAGGDVTGHLTYDAHMARLEARIRLQELQAERALAWFAGLTADRAYMCDLDHEIAVASSAYVGAAVTEIAVLRAELSGPQIG